MKSWTSWYWLVWLVAAVGIGFGVPEAIALADGDPATQPLTNWIAARGLATTAAVVSGWLFIHFWRRRRS